MLLARAGYELVVYSRNPADGLQARIVALIGGRYPLARYAALLEDRPAGVKHVLTLD
jgi:hypothetical protein